MRDEESDFLILLIIGSIFISNYNFVFDSVCGMVVFRKCFFVRKPNKENKMEISNIVYLFSVFVLLLWFVFMIIQRYRCSSCKRLFAFRYDCIVIINKEAHNFFAYGTRRCKYCKYAETKYYYRDHSESNWEIGHFTGSWGS